MSIAHFTVLYVMSVRPMLGQFFAHHAILVQAILTTLYVFCARASAMDFAELEADVAEAIRVTLAMIRMPEKVAADLLGMNLHHFQQALRRERYRELSIFKLARLGWTFWGVFLPSLSAIVLKHHLDDIVTAAKEAFAIQRRDA